MLHRIVHVLFLALCLSAASPAAAGEDAVLFEQAPNPDGQGIDAGAYARPEDILRSTEVADDFAVYDADGWTVTSIDLVAGWACNENRPDCLRSPSRFVNVRIAPDERGRPGATPICSATNAPSIYPAAGFGTAFPLTAVDFDAPCALPPGRYWVVVQFVEYEPFDAHTGLGHSSFLYASTQPYLANGSPGLFRYTHGYASDPICPDWEWVARCVNAWQWQEPAAVEYSFRIHGRPGRDPGQLELHLTATPYDPAAPDACDGSERIAVTPGDRLNLCYRLTNRSGADLAVHTLSGTAPAAASEAFERRLGVGETWQLNRTVMVEDQTQIVATWTAQDARPGYTWNDHVAASYVDLSASTTAQRDVGYLELPFAVDFFGASSRRVCVMENGYLHVLAHQKPVLCRTSAQPSQPLPAVLPTAEPAILPSWLDLVPGPTAASGTYFDVIGSEPGQRRLVFEWRDYARYQASGTEPGTITFEVTIDEASGAITFLYQDMRFADSLSPAGDYGQWAAVGLQHDANQALQYSYRDPALADGKAIRWQPTVPRSYDVSATLQLDVGAPRLALETATLEVAAPAGASARLPLRFANEGDRPLRWTLEEVPAVGAARTAPAAAPEGAMLPVPAYALTVGSPRLRAELVSTDLAAQGDGVEVILSPAAFAYLDDGQSLQSYVGGAFLGNDFDRLYLLDMYGALSVVDPASGVHSPVAERLLPRIGQPRYPWFAGLAWDDTTRTLYASGWMLDPDDEDGFRSRLYRIDAAAGTAEAVGDAQNDVEFAFIAVDTDGQMYAVDLHTDVLLLIDKATGEYEVVGPLGEDFPWYDGLSDPRDRYPGSGAGLAFDPSTRTLWFWSSPDFNMFTPDNPGLYTIDTRSGAATRVSPYSSAIANVLAFAIAVPYGDCARPGEVPWLSLATAGDTTAAGAAAEVAVDFDANGLAPGRYTARLCIDSNDPQHRHRPIAVPVGFTVTGAQSDIFASGFDAQQ
ncbi:hypothetical protein [Dokdonella sp.]|uniref:hypothetical protein n=1 Tax=Dokdonella sp. TaxID=2291710 RepID=UPI001B17477E|nr:hypothetical protein [Dokdonella sp.]MBO9663129.1 hypothetical protein [Dokdonella sp.]